MSEPTYAVITGGGTSGHVLPALAIAEQLVDAGHPVGAIHYVGARRGIEAQLLPSTAFAHTLFDVDGLQRGFSRSDISRNLRFLPRQWRARRAALRLLDELRPRVVISVGGYASLPTVFAARRRKIPIVVVSYDRRPGRSSAATARFAAAVAAAYPGSPLPRAEVTGAPVRRAIRAVDRGTGRVAARSALGIDPERFVVAVFGGSLGSGVLNEAIGRYAADHADDAELTIYHVAGTRFADRVTVTAGAALQHVVVGYEARMPELYAAADLVVGRGGASTVAEVAVTGTPAVLVPWAGAADDHQRANVEWLAESGAAVMVLESDVPTRLGVELDALRADPARRGALAAAAGEAGAVHRGDGIVELIERVAAAPATA